MAWRSMGHFISSKTGRSVRYAYTVDVPTMTQLEHSAKCWRVSKLAAHGR